MRIRHNDLGTPREEPGVIPFLLTLVLSVGSPTDAMLQENQRIELKYLCKYRGGVEESIDKERMGCYLTRIV